MSDGAVFVNDKGDQRFFYQDQFGEAEAQGFRPRGGEQVLVKDSTGDTAAIASEDLGRYVQENPEADIASTQEHDTAYDTRFEEEAYGGAGGTAAALGLGGLRGLSLGGSDLLLRGLGVDAEKLEALQRVNPYASTIGEVAGAVAPGLFTGGSSTAAQILARTPAGLVARGATAAGSGLGSGFARAGVAGVIEGGFSGLGTGVSQLALSSEPIDGERAVSVLSSNALFGAGVGTLAGIGGKALEKGIARGRNVVRSVADNIKTGRAVGDGMGIVDEIKLHYEDPGANAFIATDDQTTRAILSRTRGVQRKALQNAESLAENPGKVLDALQTERQAIKKVIDDAPEMLERLAKQDQKLLKELALELDTLPTGRTAVQLEGKIARRYADFADVKLPKGQALDVPLEDIGRFRSAMEAGEIAGQRAQAIAAMPERLARMDGLIASVKSAATPPPSFLQSALKRGAQGAGGAIGLSVAGPVGGWVGMKAGEMLSNVIGKRIGKESAAQAARMASALDSFLGVAQTAAKAAPIAATKILSGVAFGPPDTKPDRPQAPTKDKLVEAYRKREAEIRAQTTLGPTLKPMMKPAARAQVADRLAGVQALSPLLADRMETTAARKIEFLADKLPKRPDAIGIPIGPDRWQPSAMELAKFARYVAAAEDPASIAERLADGTLTTEDSEAMEAVYPEMFQKLKMDILQRLPELQQSLPYQKRLMLSIFTGVPVDPSMRPEILRQLQASFAEEAGTEGGVQAPKAQPAFGSVSKPEPTAAQERASR